MITEHRRPLRRQFRAKTASNAGFGQFQPLEPRVMLSTTYRGYDGSGNNLAHPTWGTRGTALQRLANPAYGDGISTPAGADRPSAREVSNNILAQHQAEDI